MVGEGRTAMDRATELRWSWRGRWSRASSFAHLGSDTAMKTMKAEVAALLDILRWHGSSMATMMAMAMATASRARARWMEQSVGKMDKRSWESRASVLVFLSPLGAL